MRLMECQKIAPGLFWISIPSRGVYLQCGCPADSVKHLIKLGLIRNQGGPSLLHETGPNALLLGDLSIQNGFFANLSEFSVLQMFYRQGMMIPGHPGFTAKQPIMIGNAEQIKAQLDYVFRGNYGLISEAEMQEAGLSAEHARDMMRMKLRFAFGQIKPAQDLFDTRPLARDKQEIKNGVFIQRLAVNRFEITCGKEKHTVDLNLGADETFEPTYKLPFQRFKPEFFSVIHSGEGDGWDVNRPSMASMICYGPDVYLIDAGPHITHSLRALGLSINSVRGIFQTHLHDDHFAGLTELMLGDRKLEYFATKLIRHSVDKKLQALLNVNFPVLERFFTTNDLDADRWNNIDGLEVMPQYSPHPVETNILKFRAITENGYRTYHHLADIASFTVLQKMVESDVSKPGLSAALYELVKAQYLEPADLKKIDIGGGMIHGQTEDFKDDPSGRIRLAHSAEELLPEQLAIGGRAEFGELDHLVKAHFDTRHEVAARSLHHYFPTVPFGSFSELLNQPITSIEPGQPLCRTPRESLDIFLVLSGIVADPKVLHRQSLEYVAGYLLGDDPDCELAGLSAKSYVEVLRIPRAIFDAFLHRYQLQEIFSQNIARRRLLQNSELFQAIKWSPLLSKIAKAAHEINIRDQQVIEHFTGQFLFVLATGRLELFKGPYKEELRAGHFCYEDNIVNEDLRLNLHIKALEPCSGYLIPYMVLRDIPAVEWKLLETFKRREQNLRKLILRQSAA